MQSKKPRLNRYLASCGLGSRRGVEEIIFGGRVKINGQTVREPGVRVGDDDKVEVGGKEVKPADEKVYLAVNKPPGVTSTMADKHAEETLPDILPEKYKRLKPGGRLDKNTSGLMVMSNDGDFLQKIAHPSYETEKEYEVVVMGRMQKEAEEKLEKGVMLEGRKTAPAEVKDLEMSGSETRFRMVIHEGRKRQIRKMCALVGHEVKELKRLRIGEIKLRELKEGEWRELSEKEVESVMENE